MDRSRVGRIQETRRNKRFHMDQLIRDFKLLKTLIKY